jgi:hypothetical protein
VGTTARALGGDPGERGIGPGDVVRGADPTVREVGHQGVVGARGFEQNLINGIEPAARFSTPARYRAVVEIALAAWSRAPEQLRGMTG